MVSDVRDMNELFLTKLLGFVDLKFWSLLFPPKSLFAAETFTLTVVPAFDRALDGEPPIRLY